MKYLLDKSQEGDALVVSRLNRLGRDAPNVLVLATIKTLASLGVRTIVLQLGST